MAFQYPRSISLAALPTPIQKLERLSKVLGGPEIYIKRDDLTGSALSGNKVRKLEFSIAEALDKDADILITCGGGQSNHARATAVAATMMGLKSCLVLRGKEGMPSEGNLFLDRLVGAEIRFITPEDYSNVNAIMEEIAEELQADGRKPYVIPEGASNPVGTFGYTRAAQEIGEQMGQHGGPFDVVITATGSGGTLGGLLMGKKVFDLSFQPMGINVCDSAEYFQDRIQNMLDEMIDAYDLNVEIEREEIVLIDGYVGEGYAISRPEELTFMSDVARMEGIVLDPVYTGKAMFGLRDQIRQGRFSRGQRILFIHTGGIYGLFPKQSDFDAVWNG